ncbi:MAG: glycosyltransferase, partial [Kiritimatiellae bacterium]|nr:glycosyltransferase [Kiritimatiellia bacterium]
MQEKGLQARFDEFSEKYLDTHGKLCAFTRMTVGQRAGFLLFFLGLITAVVFSPYRAWVVLSYTLALFFFFILAVRLAAILISIFRNPTITVTAAELAALRAEDLPTYSVLVPLFREPEVVPSLFTALRALDYPQEKLDIQFLVEPEDVETIAALRRCGLSANMRITESPPGLPQTKPRACNVGLARAGGEMLVIFDAEDRPEPDQLKKAVAAYQKMPPQVVCLQARLDHYNSMQTIFSQWASMEYLIWYRWILPGLQALGAAIPLGGTSNHFRIGALRVLGGWDPFNVTEDCDLGMRIARRGWQTRMLDSVTWEEAVTTPRAWLRQRTRWIKGYWQTLLVQLRRGAVKEFGFWKWLMFAVTVGGGTTMLLFNPIMWAILLAWIFWGWPMADFQDPFSVAALVVTVLLMLLNLVFIGVNIAGCLLSKRSELLPVALLSPVEWVLLGMAAWRALYQFIWQPFHWEKTPHGKAIPDVLTSPFRHRVLRIAVPAGSLAVAVAVVGLLVGLVAARIEREAEARPRQLPAKFLPPEYEEAEILYAFDDPPEHGTSWQPGETATVTTNIAYLGRGSLVVQAHFPGVTEVQLKPNTDWSRFAALRFRVFLPERVPKGTSLLVYLRDRDDLWYEWVSPQVPLPRVWTRFEVDLRDTNSEWQPRGHGKPWDGYVRQKVRVLGLRIYGHGSYSGPIYVDQIEGIRLPAALPPLAPPVITRISPATNMVPQWSRYEIAFRLNRTYSNPFDAAVVDARGWFRTPTGREVVVPAFFYQGFSRQLQEGREVLTAQGAAEWRIRFTPTEKGQYSFRITVRDHTGAEAETASQTFEATEPHDERGFVRLSRRSRGYFEFDNGEFYYPIGHNVCVPRDPLQAYPYPFKVSEAEGTYFYDRVFEKMAANGENWARIWMTSWWVGLEGRPDWPWYHGLGRYNLALSLIHI